MAATTKDYYETLGVSKNASASEIKQAYRKKALEWHPDKHQGKDKTTAEAKFKEINQAYEVLRDPQKKQTYDQFGHNAFNQGAAGAGNPFGGGSYRQGPFTYTYSTTGSDFGGFSDPFEIFEQFFGGGFGTARQRQKPVYVINIDFMEAVRGFEKQVKIDGQNKKIKIPAGVDDNSRVRFNDFDILVSVKPHPKFKRRGQDIFIDERISFSQAALGATIMVETINGPVKLKVHPGTQPGSLVRLRGRGVPFLHSRENGDQYVRFVVEVPRKLTREQRQILTELES